VGARVNSKGCPSDADGDGVLDGLDQCPNTPAGATVDAKGARRIRMGTACWTARPVPGTPRGAIVDAAGCPLDSDKDGVPD